MDEITGIKNLLEKSGYSPKAIEKYKENK